MTAGTDIALLRFLRARTDENGVLNVAAVAGAGDSAGLPERLVRAAGRLRAVASSDGRRVAYQQLGEASAYTEFRRVAAELAVFDPALLATREERLAFWINVFNALVIDAVLHFRLRGTVREAPGFFRRAAYRIGGQRFSAEEIEHGILRGNRPPLPRLQAPFAAGDPRLAFRVLPPDPRVHFALNCATLSCPPLRVYSAAALDSELDEAAAGFVQDGGVMLSGAAVAVSGIFAFYEGDFGGPAGVADWLCRYLKEPGERQRVRAAFAAGTAAYQAYDWALNDGSA